MTDIRAHILAKAVDTVSHMVDTIDKLTQHNADHDTTADRTVWHMTGTELITHQQDLDYIFSMLASLLEVSTDDLLAFVRSYEQATKAAASPFDWPAIAEFAEDHPIAPVGDYCGQTLSSLIMMGY